MKIHNKRNLQQIAINLSADIDYKDFLEIYKKCTKEPYSFLAIDTKLHADNPLRFRKETFGFFIKITLDQVKSLDNKIKTNQAQYDLDREADGEGLGYKPDVIKKSKFQYSSLGKVFK